MILILIYQKNEDECEAFQTYFPLKNVLSDESSLNVSKSRQIFLLETHMEKERILTNPRQACTVESAGKLAKVLQNKIYHNFCSTHKS